MSGSIKFLKYLFAFQIIIHFSSSFAAIKCQTAIGSAQLKTVVTEIDRIEVKGAFAKMTETEAINNHAKIVRLFKHLIIENPTVFRDFIDENTSDVKFELNQYSYAQNNLSGYKNFILKAVDKNGLEYKKNHLQLRTNGQVAFLGQTYMLRTLTEIQKYKAVYFDGSQVKSVDQGDLILSTLPHDLKISRSMSETERNRWLNNEPFWSSYGQKIHFAPSYFKFRNEPYLVPMTRAQLFEFYKRGELEINTYDVNPDMTLMDIGIEFELVFFGENAVKNLYPLMKEPLKVRNW